jgi:DNA-binding response OmpR family regulator
MNLQARDTLHAEIAALRAENDELRERLRQRDSCQEDQRRFPRAWLLTPMERKLLLLLAQSERTKTRTQIFSQVWGYESDTQIKTIDVFMTKLRKKLRTIDCGIEIKTDWGIGFYCPPSSIERLRAALEGEAA